MHNNLFFLAHCESSEQARIDSLASMNREADGQSATVFSAPDRPYVSSRTVC